MGRNVIKNKYDGFDNSLGGVGRESEKFGISQLVFFGGLIAMLRQIILFKSFDFRENFQP